MARVRRKALLGKLPAEGSGVGKFHALRLRGKHRIVVDGVVLVVSTKVLIEMSKTKDAASLLAKWNRYGSRRALLKAAAKAAALTSDDLTAIKTASSGKKFIARTKQKNPPGWPLDPTIVKTKRGRI